jgi:hypothetical protein
MVPSFGSMGAQMISQYTRKSAGAPSPGRIAREAPKPARASGSSTQPTAAAARSSAHGSACLGRAPQFTRPRLRAPGWPPDCASRACAPQSVSAPVYEPRPECAGPRAVRQ